MWLWPLFQLLISFIFAFPFLLLLLIFFLCRSAFLIIRHLSRSDSSLGKAPPTRCKLLTSLLLVALTACAARLGRSTVRLITCLYTSGWQTLYVVVVEVVEGRAGQCQPACAYVCVTTTPGERVPTPLKRKIGCRGEPEQPVPLHWLQDRFLPCILDTTHTQSHTRPSVWS